jgi:hypothetical protein
MVTSSARGLITGLLVGRSYARDLERISELARRGRQAMISAGHLTLPIDKSLSARVDVAERQEKGSPSRWRFCPLSPLTFRFRVEPSG